MKLSVDIIDTSKTMWSVCTEILLVFFLKHLTKSLRKVISSSPSFSKLSYAWPGSAVLSLVLAFLKHGPYFLLNILSFEPSCMSVELYGTQFKNPLKNPTSYLGEAGIKVGFWEVGFPQKPASTK